jgi:hypothetical protein
MFQLQMLHSVECDDCWLIRLWFNNVFSTRNLLDPYSLQEIVGRTNRLLSLMRHGPHWKRRVQQFFYCCPCIRYRRKVSTEPLPSNDMGIFYRTEPLPSNEKGIHIQTHRLMGGFFNYAVEMGSVAVNIHTKFHKDRFKRSKVKRVGYTHTHTRKATWSHKPAFFFRNEG